MEKKPKKFSFSQKSVCDICQDVLRLINPYRVHV